MTNPAGISKSKLMELNPYPEYKDSGVMWLGKVPTHWAVIPNRGAFIEVNDQNHPHEEMLSVTISRGVIKQSTLLDDSSTKDGSRIDRSSYKLIKPGDIAYNKMRAWQGAIGVSIYRGIISPAYVVERPREGNNPDFLHYLLRTPAFAKEAERNSYGIASDMWSLRPEHFKTIRSCLPPPEEQAAIVRYLDDAGQRIRAYVSAKERLIALLEEERQAVIHQAVTRGLDPNVKLKPSGVEWLGEVPEHWEVVQLGRIGSFSKGSGGTKDDEVPKGIPCIRYGDLYTTHKFFIDHTKSFIPEEKLNQYTSIKKGDVLFPASGETIEEIGKSAVNLLDAPVYCGGDLIIFRPSLTMDPKFSGYVLDTPISQDQKSRMGRGVSIMHIYSNQLKYLWLGLPPTEEQTATAEHIDKATTEIDAAIDRAHRQINLMEEYRTRLIADVVTGKLDVREAATFEYEST